MRVCIKTALTKSKDAAVPFSIVNIVEKHARTEGGAGTGAGRVFFKCVRTVHVLM